MRNRTHARVGPTLGLAFGCLSLACQQAAAQQQTESQQELEEVLVTGSFIERPADRPQPVSVLTNEEIEANQRITLTEVIRDMPQVANANTTSNSLNPSNSIDLRGLGDRSTLVLLNGQRQTIDANDNSVVDVNNLAPSLMVERVELVLDGSSALYGSDAVAGVVNFITRDDFEGLDFQVGSQFAEAQTDVPELNAGAIFGYQGDRTGLVTSVEWTRRDDVMEASDIRSLERLEQGLKTGFFNPGTFFSAGDNAFHPDPLCGSTEIGGIAENRWANPAGYMQGDGFCRGLLTLRRTLIPETETLTGMAVVTHDFDTEQETRLRFEMSMAKAEMRRHEGTGLPFLGLSEINAFMPAENPGIIDANRRDPSFPVADVTSIFSRQKSPAEGPVVMRTEQWTYRTALGLEGIFGDGGWDWSLDATYSTNDQFSQDVDTIASRFTAAVAGFGGPGCKWNPVLGADDDPNELQAGVGPCQWYNPFASRLIAEPGDPTYNDPELVDWMQWGESPLAESRLYTAEGVVTGDLWERPAAAPASRSASSTAVRCSNTTLTRFRRTAISALRRRSSPTGNRTAIRTRSSPSSCCIRRRRSS